MLRPAMFDGVIDGLLNDAIQVRRKHIVPDQYRLGTIQTAFNRKKILRVRRQFVQRGREAIDLQFNR